jgi:hypothetical protein
METLQKSPVNKKFYLVSSLSLETKIKLGFNKAVVNDLKKVDQEQKKSPVKKRKEENN